MPDKNSWIPFGFDVDLCLGSAARLASHRFLSGEPTTGAIKGNDFYFILNSQIGNMKDGRVIDPAKLEPIRIAKTALP